MIYLYQLEYPDGSPFYIGVSTNIRTRLLGHINESRKQISVKDKVIWDLWLSGFCPTIRALAVFENRDEATRVEYQYIGRFPLLVNVQGNSTRSKLERWYELYCPDCARNWTNERVRNWCNVSSSHQKCIPISTWKLNPDTGQRLEYKEIIDGAIEAFR